MKSFTKPAKKIMPIAKPKTEGLNKAPAITAKIKPVRPTSMRNRT